ncbi:hypothetical protein PInf_023741 [Phytophthora infestans]|nr:hypothetical protein PInf_023741 [Phytophthora infestans]
MQSKCGKRVLPTRSWRERTVSSLIQTNLVKQTQPLRKYTTSIGLRANYHVDDDPILRYAAGTRPSGSVADEEVAEFVLRLVFGRLGDSQQVFHALKTEIGFSQAYTAYSMHVTSTAASTLCPLGEWTPFTLEFDCHRTRLGLAVM